MRKQSNMQSFLSGGGGKKSPKEVTLVTQPTSSGDAWAGFECASTLNKRSITGQGTGGSSNIPMIVIDDDDADAHAVPVLPSPQNTAPTETGDMDFPNPYANNPHPAVKKQRTLPNSVSNSGTYLNNAVGAKASSLFHRSNSFTQSQSQANGNKVMWITPASTTNTVKYERNNKRNDENNNNLRGNSGGDDDDGDWISSGRTGPFSTGSKFKPVIARTVSSTANNDSDDDVPDSMSNPKKLNKVITSPSLEDSDEEHVNKGRKTEHDDDDDDEERIRKSNLMKTNYSLSTSQKTVLDAIMQRRSVFFTGAAGTGKSFIIQIIRDAADVMGIADKVSFTAPTGIAACNIQGLTVHSWAGIGMGYEPIDKLLPIVERNRHAQQRWRQTEILVIDEISMLSAEFLDKLDIIGRRLRNKCHLPFGGIQIVLCGDFFQLPPVGLGKNAKFCFESNVWKELFEDEIGGGSNRGKKKRTGGLMICLNKVFRQKDDSLFLNLLTEIRSGIVSKISLDILQQKAIESLHVDHEKQDIRPTKLFSTNNDVDAFNEQEMKRLCQRITNNEGDDSTLEMIVYKAVDTGKEQYMSQLKNGMKVPGELKLCKGAQVMLLKNLDVQSGLVNGARGSVIGFAKDVTGRFSRVPIVKFRTVDGRDVVETIKAESWSIKQGDVELASRNQIPLMLAWAISIHKSQGMTIPLLEVSFNRMFEFGQAYVALSRATSLSGLTLKQFQGNVIKAHPLVKQFYLKLAEISSHRQQIGPDSVCQATLKDFVKQFGEIDTSYDNDQWLESRNNPYNKTLTTGNTTVERGGRGQKFDEFKFLEGSDFDAQKRSEKMNKPSNTHSAFVSPMTPATFVPSSSSPNDIIPPASGQPIRTGTVGSGTLSNTASVTKSGPYKPPMKVTAKDDDRPFSSSKSTVLSNDNPGRVLIGRINAQSAAQVPPHTYFPVLECAALSDHHLVNENPVQQLPLSDDLKRRIEDNRQAALAKLATFKKRREEETAAAMESYKL